MLVGLLLAGHVGAAQFQASALMPTKDNADTTCTVPQLSNMGTNPALKWHWRWWVAGGDSTSPAVIQDSLAVTPGLSYSTPVYAGLPAGTLLRMRSWCTDAGGKSCDTLITFVPFKVRPWGPHKL